MKQSGSIIWIFIINLFVWQQIGAKSRVVTENGFVGCVELSNSSTRVVLEPNIGGRVLKYELNGNNVLYIDTTQNGLDEEPEKMSLSISGGRFDVGPAKIIPKHKNLWFGKWEAEITGDFSARLTSKPDKTLGIQLIREFSLDTKSSKLICKQTIKNISNETKRYCYWGRTLVKGGGIRLAPLNPKSRYPKQYISYGKKKELFFEPEEEESLTIMDNTFILKGTSKYKKYITDSEDGWLANLSKDSLLFITSYNVYPDKIYGEMTGCTASFWFLRDEKCEVEPLGPWDIIEPAETSSFSETWHLFDYTKKETIDDNFSVVKKVLNRYINQTKAKGE